MAGKWHLSDDPVPYGFDDNFGGYHRGHSKSYFSPYQNPNLTDGPNREHLPYRLAQEVSSWITGHRSQPFFVYFPFYSVHTPLKAQLDLVETYREKNKGKHHNHPEYAAMIQAMDEAVGKILATLDTLNLTNRTVVIFSSDNGPFGGVSVAKPLRGNKGMYYEGGIREPMIVRWPEKIKAAITEDFVWAFWDVMPTLAELVGIAPPSDIDGISVVTTLLSQEQAPHKYLYWEFFSPFQQAVRMGKWKAIRLGTEEPIHLYNLEDDITETQNVALSHPDIVTQIEEIMQTAHSPNPYWPMSDKATATAKEMLKK